MYLFNTRMANGWKHIATSFSGVPDVAYPPPRHLVEKMASLCPGFCVLWVVKVFVTPANTEIRRGYHMICRYVPETRYDVEPINIDVVSRDFPYPAKKIYESRILEQRDPFKRGNPARYLPFSDWWLHELRRMWWERNRQDQKRMEKTARAFAQSEKAKREEPLKRAQDEALMRVRSRRAAIRQAVQDDLDGKPARPLPSPNRVYSLPSAPATPELMVQP